jgi:hypothetical protein
MNHLLNLRALPFTTLNRGISELLDEGGPLSSLPRGATGWSLVTPTTNSYQHNISVLINLFFIRPKLKALITRDQFNRYGNDGLTFQEGQELATEINAELRSDYAYDIVTSEWMTEAVQAIKRVVAEAYVAGVFGNSTVLRDRDNTVDAFLRVVENDIDITFDVRFPGDTVNRQIFKTQEVIAAYEN